MHIILRMNPSPGRSGPKSMSDAGKGPRAVTIEINVTVKHMVPSLLKIDKVAKQRKTDDPAVVAALPNVAPPMLTSANFDRWNFTSARSCLICLWILALSALLPRSAMLSTVLPCSLSTLAFSPGMLSRGPTPAPPLNSPVRSEYSEYVGAANWTVRALPDGSGSAVVASEGAAIIDATSDAPKGESSLVREVAMVLDGAVSREGDAVTCVVMHLWIPSSS